MTDPIFDHGNLDVYRLSIEYEYRDAEYEYETRPEQSNAWKSATRSLEMESWMGRTR